MIIPSTIPMIEQISPAFARPVLPCLLDKYCANVPPIPNSAPIHPVQHPSTMERIPSTRLTIASTLVLCSPAAVQELLQLPEAVHLRIILIIVHRLFCYRGLLYSFCCGAYFCCSSIYCNIVFIFKILSVHFLLFLAWKRPDINLPGDYPCRLCRSCRSGS